MYNAVRFKPFTSREDFIINGSIFDQDTGQGINLSGVTGNGTFSNWTVKIGSIQTTSTTTIVVPQLPLGNQFSALALIVPPNLAIVVGNPVTITSPFNTVTMTGFVTSYAASTGALVVQIGLTFQFEIRRKLPHLQDSDTGFVPFFDVGVPSDFGPIIQASLGNGILITDIGFYQIRIAETTFRQLRAPRTYYASLTVTDSQDTRQIFVGELPVIYGGVTL